MEAERRRRPNEEKADAVAMKLDAHEHICEEKTKGEIKN
jgi:hypothetical protein